MMKTDLKMQTTMKMKNQRLKILTLILCSLTKSKMKEIK